MKVKHITKALAKKQLPRRNRISNKTDGGKLIAVAGSRGMFGAGILAALAATRLGAGYTYLMLDWNSKQLLKHPDILFLKPKLKHLETIVATAYVIGPGLGQSPSALKKLEFFLKKQKTNVVLDADGLNLLAKQNIKRLPDHWILTPHEGELARLLKTSSAKIRNNPIKYVLAAQKKYQCTILLKGAITYIADDKSVWISKTGTPALAKAGTGDVLSGMIGALLAQGLSPVMAASIGAYIHGLASRHFLKTNDVLSLRPLDLIDRLPIVLKSLRR